MAPRNRNNPKASPTSDGTYTRADLEREFPDDATCLDYLWRQNLSDDGEHADCPKCHQRGRFHRVKDRPSYSCDTCGHHLHPTAGTVFHKSSTGLDLWFKAIFLMGSTRCGVSAKQIERELGVTYKTAWRMANLIRNKLMPQDDEPLSGEVEVDETYVGGKPPHERQRSWPWRERPLAGPEDRRVGRDRAQGSSPGDSGPPPGWPRPTRATPEVRASCVHRVHG